MNRVNCVRCQNHGYYGGKLDGPFAGPWKWCSCAAALEAQESQPELVDQANAAREWILGMNGAVRVRAKTVQREEYHGEF